MLLSGGKFLSTEGCRDMASFRTSHPQGSNPRATFLLKHQKGLSNGFKRGKLCVRNATFQKDAELAAAVWQAVQKETVPWVKDLLFPLLGVRDEYEVQAAQAPAAPPTALADADSKFVNVHGIDVHYKERTAAPTTSPEAPTLLFIHGFNASTFSWRANLDAVAAATGLRAVAFDRPPFGLTERPLSWGAPNQQLQFNPYELEGSLNITESLLDALNIGPVIVIGHSAGALVALGLQQRRPAQVTALALVAPAVPTTPSNSFQRRATFGSQLRFLATRAVLQSDAAGLRFVRRQVMQQRERVAQGDLGFVPHPLTSSSASGSLSSASESLSWEDAADVALQEAVDGYLKPLRARDWDRAALLNLRAFALPMSFEYAGVTAPALVVQGTQDGGLIENARALAEILRERPGSPMTVFSEFECGHVPMDEMPEQFNATLIDFCMNVARKQ